MDLEEIHKWVREKRAELARDIKKNTAEISRHNTQLDKVYLELLDHRRRLERLEENMFTKAEGREIKESLDFLIHRMQKTSDDHDAAIEWLKRHELHLDRLDVHTGLA